MLLLGTEVFLVTYIATKVIKKTRYKKDLIVKAKTQKEVVEKEINKNLTISTVSVGLTTFGSLYLPLLTPLGIIGLTYSSIQFFERIEKNLLNKKNKKINAELLDGVILVGCVVSNSYILASIVAWYNNFANKLFLKIQDGTEKAISDIFVEKPNSVWILKNSIEIEIPLKDIQKSDIVVIKSGEVIPIDGIIVNGIAMIDEHTLNGESTPAEKIVGDNVFASTIVINGKIYIETKEYGNSTIISKVGNILSQTSEFKTNLQLKATKIADKSVIPILMMAVASIPFIGFMPCLTILYSRPGNQIQIYSSLQILGYIKSLSKHGLLIKDGRTLEKMKEIDAILFDKTGTLTLNHPTVGEILTFGSIDRDTILTYAGIAECRVAHPIAHAIYNKAKEENLISDNMEIDDSNYHIGYGIKIYFNGENIYLGSIRFMEMENIKVPLKVKEIKEELEEKGSTIVLLAVDNRIEGGIEIEFPIRREVKESIHKLRKHGIKYIAIVSGDHKKPTKKLADILEVDEFFYDVLPTEKSKIVETLQKSGKKVCFVGDGINDSIAIKRADVSISLNGSTSIATDLAQVVLTNDSLLGIPKLLEISKKLDKESKESLAITLFYTTTTIMAGAILRVGPIFPLTVGTVQFLVGMGHASKPLLKSVKKTNKEKSDEFIKKI